MQNLIKHIRTSLSFVAGSVTTHFISKALDHQKTQSEQIAQMERDRTMESLKESADILKDKANVLQNSCDRLIPRLNNDTTTNNISEELAQKISQKAKDTQEIGENLDKLIENNSLSDPNVLQQVSNGFKKIQANSKELQDFVDQVYKHFFPPLHLKGVGGGDDKKFIENFNLDSLYAYLDSLSLLQESALIHVLLFIIIFLTLINIFAALFANEILKYFDLENKYPSISSFLKLRAKFQKFYLTWNILFLLFLILAAILLNIFIFIVC